MLKHRLKMGLKSTLAGAGLATGAWRLANRLNPCGRVTILTLHCVGHPKGSDYLPSYMKLSEKRFDHLLGSLARSFDMIGLKEALQRLETGEKGSNCVVITLDDGYRDNLTHALPLLKKHGVPATIFLEAGAVDRRSLTWIHKFFFTDRCKDSAYIADEYARRTHDEGLSKRLRAAILQEEDMEYAVKRILKYEADRIERDQIFDSLFKESGGDEQQALDAAYLNWDEVKTMAREEGISFGCHTVSHPILSSLTKEETRLEIREARKLIEEHTGLAVDTFAYPWGRPWDFNDETVEVLKEEGFCCGLALDNLSARPGRCDFFRMSRFAVSSDLNLADIVAQASGLYSLFGGKLQG
ncbi:MAG: polysaccharide deacetylase family protein [Planctomycetota bacterium]|jgi:peptidoglycan/xylan/chitin deacetylase (PgdA/CDA1 family)